MGFFTVHDVPARRVVQYKRVSSSVDGAVHLEDESVLGEAVDQMPYADKTGITVAAGGTLYEVPYLEDAGDVYFAKHPADTTLKDGSAKLSVSVKGGKPGYDYQWYKDGKEVVNIPYTEGELTVKQAGKYFVKVIDADGVEAVSKEAEVKPKAE